jgi:hypothetical protein
MMLTASFFEEALVVCRAVTRENHGPYSTGRDINQKLCYKAPSSKIYRDTAFLWHGAAFP